jgi:peptidoglycan-N-acetylglucosamine deacetylase
MKWVTRIAIAAKAVARPVIGTTTHVATGERVAALTFDDGPNPVYTPRLLEVLDRHGARATFFMIGEQASRHPDIVERVAAEGHAIGNHSWDHPSFPRITRPARRRQIRACEGALAPHGMRLFRFPKGHQTPATALDVRLQGYDPIGWNVDPRDYTDRTAAAIAAHVLSRLRPGSIVLLHDAIHEYPESDRTATLEAVDSILASASRDYAFLTVPELLRRGRRQRIHAFWRLHP